MPSYLHVTVACKLFIALLDCYATHRQLRKLHPHKPIPPQMASLFPAAAISRLHSHARALATLQLLSGLYDAVLEAIFTLSLFPAHLWFLSNRLLPSFAAPSELAHSIVFVVLLAAITVLFSLPSTLFHALFIQPRFGHPRPTIQTVLSAIARDAVSSACVALPIFLLVYCALHALSHLAPTTFAVVLFTVASLFAFLVLVVYPVVIAPMFLPQFPMRDSPLRTNLIRVANDLKYPVHDVYITRQSTRCVPPHYPLVRIVGLSKRRILLDSSLLRNTTLSAVTSTATAARADDADGVDADVVRDGDANHGGGDADKDIDTVVSLLLLEIGRNRYGQRVVYFAKAVMHIAIISLLYVVVVADIDVLFTSFGFPPPSLSTTQTSPFKQTSNNTTTTAIPAAATAASVTALQSITDGNVSISVYKPVIISLLLFNNVLSPLDDILQPVHNFLSRRVEFCADAFVKGRGFAPSLAEGMVERGLGGVSNVMPDAVYCVWNYGQPTLCERLMALGVPVGRFAWENGHGGEGYCGNGGDGDDHGDGDGDGDDERRRRVVEVAHNGEVGMASVQDGAAGDDNKKNV